MRKEELKNIKRVRFNDYSNYDYDEEEYSCGDFETVTTDELLEKINSFEEKDGEYIEFK